jgi:hypothetical protein
MPTPADMYLWCKERAPKTMKKTLLMDIADASNGNPGYALQMIKSKHAGTKITATTADNEKAAARARLADDPWLYPLRFHENLVKELSNKKGTKTQKIEVYRTCLNTLCEWDYMMAIVEDPMCALEHVCNAITTVLPTLEYKKGVKKDNASDEFTKIFSNLSLQKKQERNLHANGLDFPWMDAHILCDYRKWK